MLRPARVQSILFLGAHMGPQTLEKAERLELLAAELYGLAASRFSADCEAKELLERLQEEEIQHAYRVRMLRSQCIKDAKLAAGLGLDDSRIELLLERGADARKQIVAAKTLAEVLDLLLELEETFAVAHAEAVTVGADPQLHHFFESLAHQDTQHRLLLERVATQVKQETRG